MDHSSLQELLTPITARTDPTPYSIRVAVLPDGQRPEPGDWHNAEWLTLYGTPYASLLVGPGGAVQLAAGAYRAWVEITAPPEKPVVVSPPFQIT
ncbi:hypothetical protein ACFVIY_17735 [Streptomyces sp. NPDC127166]|uniref:hypothetical protein n=1 Tax=Streptomyces sp. NPDC127166 TaxID=3345380 RepID=UPI00362B73D5